MTMEDVTDEIRDADITVEVDTREETQIPPSMLEIGKGIKTLHEETQLRVIKVEMDTEHGHPPEFRIVGSVANSAVSN